MHPRRQWDLLLAPVCKYCRRRFIKSTSHYRSHVRHHELIIKPYWYKNPKLPPKAGHVNLKQSKHQHGQNPIEVNYNKPNLKRRQHKGQVQQEDSQLTTDFLQNDDNQQSGDKHVCRYCRKLFGTVSNRIAHEMKQNLNNVYKCELCGLKFYEFCTMMQHQHDQVAHGETRKRHVKFKPLFYRSQHEVTHREETLRSCSYCDKIFSQIKTLKLHKMTHMKLKPHKCRYFTKSFNQLSTKKNHEMIHTGKKPYKCIYCSKSFGQAGHKKRHEMFHTGEKPHKCRYCFTRFTSKSDVKQHEITHTGEKPHKCYCDKVFNNSSSKKRHEMVHRIDKPYRCSYCNRSFSSVSDKTRHEMIHTGEKPYKCCYCKKSFSRVSTKKQHELIHTGEKRLKPHICSICNKSFFTVSLLKQHKITHTDQKPFECSYCKKAFKCLRYET